MTIDTRRFHTLLVEERHRIERALEITATEDGHVAETATATVDRGMLAAIDDSLRRIEDGTYGTCARCASVIQVERLEAYPWASLCIDCKRLAERG
jgi:RNA polymerase-binding protein DksA